MRKALLLLVPLVALAAVTPRARSATPSGDSVPQGATARAAELLTADAVMRMPKIDAHAHVGRMNAAQRQAFVRFLEKYDLRWLAIATGGMNAKRLDEQIGAAKDLHAAYPKRIAWATSFHLSNWGDPGWASAARRTIDEGFSSGAVAVKIWKDVGMELKDADGRYVMASDPRLDPVYELTASRHRTLVAHLGEPRNCWLPLDKMTVESDRNYFSKNPQYHGYLHPEVPGYEQQIGARDALLERHPELRVVGCHLGSLEYDVDELAKRLEKFPNFAVDLAARIVHFQVQPREKVIAFIVRYQDRLLYGTDLDFGGDRQQAPEAIQQAIGELEAAYRLDAEWLATDGEVEVSRVRAGFKSRGLALPAPVLRKVYFENARTWYPGL